MLNLRTIEGLDCSFVYNKEKDVDDLIRSNLIKLQNNRIVPTYEGMMVLDQIILKLIS